jgi:hypothetical protein
MLNAHTRLEKILAHAARQLLQMDNETASVKPAPGKWSPKEILGHLLDSAANNLQRFVRLQLEDNLPLPQYRQDEWVAVQHYQSYDWMMLVHVWETYNRHLLHVLSALDKSKLANTGHFPDYGPQSLQFIIDDYVDHMEHHLKAINVYHGS